MWKPPERVRHTLPPEAPPTADEAARSRLFSRLELASGLGLESRAWVPAMVPWRATGEGAVTDAVVAWYERFARGEPGALVVEATGVRDVPSGPLLRAGHERFVPGLARLPRAVRAASAGKTRLFVQLIDFLRVRRRPERARFFGEFLRVGAEHRARLADMLGDQTIHTAPEPRVRALLGGLGDEALAAILTPRELCDLTHGARERVSDVDVPEVRALPEVLPALFAAAARRARDAGFDGVELHMAHAYTLASFLSATNTRGDGWGGTLAGRLRLPLDVVRAVRAELGPTFTVGARILADEVIAGGSTEAEVHAIACALAREGLDFLSLSTGGKFDDAKAPKVGEPAYPYTGPSGFECMPTALADARGPFSRQVARHARVRAALREAGLATPTVTAGGVGTFAQAEAILQAGQADLVGAARQSLADPDWWKKVREGRALDVRRCQYTNYCEALDQRHREVTCRLWDRQGLDDPDVPRTACGKRRLTAP